ncbi:MAG: DUF58 domain-containing protein [Capsulimonadales bacterium]|nr:DUF58 domain-containing protein [Capsulimonadales bacterium]
MADIRTGNLIDQIGAAMRAARIRREYDDRLPFPAFDSTKDLFQHPAFSPPKKAPRRLYFVYYPSPLSRMLWRLSVVRFTRAGRWFALLTFALFFIGSFSIEIQVYVPFLYAAALWGVAFLGVLLFRPRVTLTARHPDRVRAGETLVCEVSVTQNGHLPGLDLQLLPARLPLRIDAVPPDGVPLGTMRRGETRRARLGLFCPRRGAYPLWGWRVETDFPTGLMTAYRSFPQSSTLFVHPNFTTIRQMEVPIGRRHQPGGVALASKIGESMEYLGNREFREGDNVRDIDWRATARLGGTPIVREWREEYFQRVGVVLDTFVPPDLPVDRKVIRRVLFERAVSLAAAVGDYMARQDYLVDIFAAGPNLYHLTAGRSLAYLEQILDILACVEESETEPLSVVEPQILGNLEQLTSVVCVFLEWDEVRQAFVENLRRGGAGVKVLLLVEEPTTVATRDVTVIDRDLFRSGAEVL